MYNEKNFPIYKGNDLGAVYSKDKTCFRVWAPTATKVELCLYKEGSGANLISTQAMTKDDGGTWYAQESGDLHGIYYTYKVSLTDKDGKPYTNEVVDIYARAVGVNGNRGMVVDLSRTNPEGFLSDKRPPQEKDTDAIIYEVHYRDLSMDESSGIKAKGKFASLAERRSVNSDGLATGIDHILDLGVTHVQIQPSYDYATVDESIENNPTYNWGYDPKNYNAPEGSYATDAKDATVRIREMKAMVCALHSCGLRVNMDVVYNHTYDIENSWFHKTVPEYYHRQNPDGTYSNGSACGNETASDHEMMRRYMVDSVCYWAREYHIDGFRFDLMGVHDMKTMMDIRKALDEIDPSIMVYGEGWSGGSVALDYAKLAMKCNTYQMDRVGAFSDDIRDGIKGNVFLDEDQGFVNGGDGLEDIIRFGVVGAISHPQLEGKDVPKPWTNAPGQSINYASCHDNYALWDKLSISNKNDKEADRIKMNLLSAAIIFTAQGVPFILAGEEMLRSKVDENGQQVENSYCSPDSVNSIKWAHKKKNLEIYNYYKGLIAIRKANPSLRLQTADEVQTRLRFMENVPKGVVAYQVDDIIVIYNANKSDIELKLPAGKWGVCAKESRASASPFEVIEGVAKVPEISAMILKANN